MIDAALKTFKIRKVDAEKLKLTFSYKFVNAKARVDDIDDSI